MELDSDGDYYAVTLANEVCQGLLPLGANIVQFLLVLFVDFIFEILNLNIGGVGSLREYFELLKFDFLLQNLYMFVVLAGLVILQELIFFLFALETDTSVADVLVQKLLHSLLTLLALLEDFLQGQVDGENFNVGDFGQFEGELVESMGSEFLRYVFHENVAVLF